MATRTIEIEAGHLKRIWLSKYFRDEFNPEHDPLAPVWLIEEEIQTGAYPGAVRYVRHRGFDFEATGDFRGGTDLGATYGPLPRGWVETRGSVVVYYENDGWPEAGTQPQTLGAGGGAD